MEPPLIVRDSDVFEFWVAQGHENLEPMCDRLDALMHVFNRGGIYFVSDYYIDFISGG